ncbi:MAG: HAD-IIA family hydrolase [Candidatus Krumholzibacteriia bacterium]
MPAPREYRAYLCDVEGVLVRDKRYQAVPGSVAWFNGLAARGIATCLVSNNSTHDPDELIDALRAAGFAVAPAQLVTALALGAAWLAAAGRRRLLWLGHPRLDGWWRERGFTLLDAPPRGGAADAAGGRPGRPAEPSGEADAVVLGVNPTLGVADLDRALPPLLAGGAALIALHRNHFWLDERGERRLGPGAWCAALEAAAGCAAVTIGKPEAPIYREALKRVGVAASEALFISDDPLADLPTAKRLGMGTAFVLSGKHADHAVLGRLEQDAWPDVICDRPEHVD